MVHGAAYAVGSGLISDCGSTLAESFDRRAFAFQHSLSSHALFQLPRLAELCQRLGPEGLVTLSDGSADAFAGWAGLRERSKSLESMSAAIGDIRDAGAWLKITQAQRDPQYAQLLWVIIDELAALSGRSLRREITRMSATVFVSSPGAVTPYHMDHETNFLFQIHGTKTIRLWNGSDPEVLPAVDIERFLARGQDAAYREQLARKATPHELRPGRGLHQPSLWPHWAKTGLEPSVSLSVNFCLHARDLGARVHQCNFYLRRVGLRPGVAGRSRLRDRLKQLTFASPWRLRRARSIDQHVRGHLWRVEAPLRGLRWLRRLRTGLRA